jgi:hypothetical protein
MAGQPLARPHHANGALLSIGAGLNLKRNQFV